MLNSLKCVKKALTLLVWKRQRPAKCGWLERISHMRSTIKKNTDEEWIFGPDEDERREA